MPLMAGIGKPLPIAMDIASALEAAATLDAFRRAVDNIG
jgi:hypothetical protein